MFKKSLALLLAILMVIGMTACGNKGGGGGGEGRPKPDALRGTAEAELFKFLIT